MEKRPSILYITDLYYKANNREYYKEDLYITSKLRADFDILICHPLHSQQFEELFDLIVIRNSGPTIYYKEYFDGFFDRVKNKQLPVYNSFDGLGDMLGKAYLLTLTKKGYPVIPTINNIEEINSLPASNKFILKPEHGADSIGRTIITIDELQATLLADNILQPFIDFEYEVSFYYIDNVFQYALYAPNKAARWQLEPYSPDADDLAFAESFVAWNTMTHGIQRVDACRTKEGKLLLVELEDLNPFLSLDLLDKETRKTFIENFKGALNKAIGRRE